MVDMSETEIGLMSDRQFPPGCKVRITLTSGAPQCSLCLPGVVRIVMNGDGGRHRLDIAFLDLRGADRSKIRRLRPA